MTEYLIFARKSYQQPLELLGALRMEGEVQADQPRLVEKARAQFGKENWIEMIAIPSAAVTKVIPTSDF